MGVKGLTTFIKNKKDFCMETYELHDTSVVIDGDAVLCQLYLNHTFPSNTCFGGDYDIYGNAIFKFFRMLFQCKIKPYIILDGGYESRKMERIYSRFKERVQDLQRVVASKHETNKVIPLFIREAFEDIALKLGINVIRCDFEGDRETANIAKTLKCPVISNDSDFYIYDIPYIPFPSVVMEVKTGFFVDPGTQQRSTYRYIPCEIYRVDKFLSCVGGMNKENLPIFAALVGNDFMDGIDLRKLGIYKRSNNFLIKIETIINWLRKETKDSAIDKVLNSYDPESRAGVFKKIEDAINGYSYRDSKYLKYLGIEVDSSSEYVEDEYNSYEKMTQSFPKPFIENFRKSLYPTRFMDILTQNKYYNFKPQVEVTQFEQAHAVSFEIISAVHKILMGDSPNLVCLIRSGSNAVDHELPLCEIDLPSLVEIQTLDLESRKNVIHRILRIDESFISNSLRFFPESWHLVVLTVKYMLNKSLLTEPVAYSVILCKLVIDFIDPKIGFFRTTGAFNKEYSAKLKTITHRKIETNKFNNLKSALDNITDEDSLLALNHLIAFFAFDRHLEKDSNLFDKKLMHQLSQFQSCLLHVKGLNQLVNMAYLDFFITECYNGTFVYNMSKNLGKRDDVDNYMQYLLRKTPLFLYCFDSIIKLIKGEMAKNN